MERIDMINQRTREIDSRLAQLRPEYDRLAAIVMNQENLLQRDLRALQDSIMAYNNGYNDSGFFQSESASLKRTRYPSLDSYRNEQWQIGSELSDLENEKRYLEKCRYDSSLDLDYQQAQQKESEECARIDQKAAEEKAQKEAEARAQYRFKVNYSYQSGTTTRVVEYLETFSTEEEPEYTYTFALYTNKQDAEQAHLGSWVEEAPVGKCYDTDGELMDMPNSMRYNSALAGLSTAKSNINNDIQTSEDFEELGEEFDSIKQVLQSLPSSFDVQEQIKECANYQKQCEEKRQRKAEEERKEAERQEAEQKAEQLRQKKKKQKVFFTIIIITILTVVALYIINRNSGKRPESEMPVPVVISVTATVISDALNFRSSPSSNAAVLKTLKKGDTLTVIGDIDGDWIPVKHGSEPGYVNSKYVSIIIED